MAPMGIDCQLTGVAAGCLRGGPGGLGVISDLVDRCTRLAVSPLFGAAVARGEVDEGQLFIVDDDRASVAVHLPARTVVAS